MTDRERRWLRAPDWLFVALDRTPRFDLAALAAGGDGLDRGPRWLAHVGHLDQPVSTTLPALELLARLPQPGWWCAADTPVDDRDAVEGLVRCGLVRAALGVTAPELPALPAWWPPAALAHRHGRWQAIDVARQAQALGELDAAALAREFGPLPAPQQRRVPAAEPIALPAAEHATGFDRLLRRRRTCRNFACDAGVDARCFGTMLGRVFAALGTFDVGAGALAVCKTSPAGGGMHAIEAYPLVQRVEGLAPGLYHYLALDHLLEPLQRLDAGAAGQLAQRFVAGQDWFAPAAVLVVMTARYDRLYWKYRQHAKAWRVSQLDAGHLSQTLYLSATELGLGAFVTCAINDVEIEHALGLDPMREGVVAICGFGPIAADRLTLELDQVVPTVAATRLP